MLYLQVEAINIASLTFSILYAKLTVRVPPLNYKVEQKMPEHKSGKKHRKHNRNKICCEVYKKCGRQEINKAKKIARHQKAHPNDKGTSLPVNYIRKKPLEYFEKIFYKKA